MADQNRDNRNAAAPAEEDMSELLKIRRQKLADLQAAGKDPFVITKYDQTHHTDEVKALYEAAEAAKLAGRKAPETDGLEEAEARAVKKADYEERRAIMDAEPIEVSIAGRLMFKRVMGKASFCPTMRSASFITSSSVTSRCRTARRIKSLCCCSCFISL